MLKLIKNLLNLNTFLGKQLRSQQLYDEAIALHNAKAYRKSFPLMLEAAELGKVQAKSVLGTMYLLGQGTSEDGNAAVRWLTQAYEEGFKDAGAVLGMALATGKSGVRINMASAIEFMKEASALGDHQSAEMLTMIEQGKGIFSARGKSKGRSRST